MSKNVLIIGATRGLGKALVDEYSKQTDTNVYATARYTAPFKHKYNVHWMSNVDIATNESGQRIASLYSGDAPFDIVIITAGVFIAESFDKLDWKAELQMYQTSAIGPVFLVRHLVHANLLHKGSKIILVTSESGSITLRHEKEGGGNYGHHASKAAENMVGKLLSLDLKEKGIAVANVHPGFMRTEMTKSVGFDKFWDEGGGELGSSPRSLPDPFLEYYEAVRIGPSRPRVWNEHLAVTPDIAAHSLIEWIETFDISKTGQYWAPRGPGDIGTADVVLGPKEKLSTPLELPW